MTQDRTDMRVLRGAPDVQDITPKQRACEHAGERILVWGWAESKCLDCGLWIDPEEGA